MLGKVVGIFNIYQAHNSNPIYNYYILKSCFKESDQIGKTSDVAIKIQWTKHKFISKKEDK